MATLNSAAEMATIIEKSFSLERATDMGKMAYRSSEIDMNQEDRDLLIDISTSNNRIVNNNIINVLQSNENNSTANATSFSSIQQVINIINLIPNNELSKEEKNELEDKLSAVEVAKNSKDKGKISLKVGAVLKYIADKGIEVGIAALPYILETLKTAQSL